MRVGCGWENIVLVTLSRSESGALFVRGGHYLNKYCVTVYRSIFIFFQKGLPSRYTRQFPFPLPGGATISAKFRSKIAKSPKIDGKVCAHHFRLRFE